MSSTGAAAGSPLGAAVARVFGADGRPVGGAFLAAPRRLVTVAHVVNHALGRPEDATARPAERLCVDFPLVAPRRFLAAEVVHWVPPVLTGGSGEVEDVAGLRLVGEVPAGAAPVTLLDSGDRMDLRAVVLGFPAFSDDGVWSVGRLRGRQAGGWVQIDNDPTSRFALEKGFSGVPVWDVDAAAAVGMVVAAWSGATQSGYLIPASGVFAAWPALREMARPPSPFPGLRAFGEQDAGVFFGRSGLADRIVHLTGSAPVVTVVGPSGVGKSSLLYAGVLPALRARGDAEILLVRPSEAGTPLRSLALALDRALVPHREAAERTDQVTRLTDRLRDGAVREIAAELLHGGERETLLLVVDQWEEAFAGPPEEADDFGRVLAEVLRPGSPLRLLAALRADLLGAALQRPATAPLVHDQWNVTVAEMETDGLREVVTRPVERVRTVRFADGLVDRLMADVGDAPGRLPLVQFALAELWRSQRDGLLTHEAYEAMGTVRNALAHHADLTWTGLTPDERQRASRLLVQLVRPVPGAAGFTRRLAPRSDFSEGQWAVAGRLATARLVVLREPERTGDGTDDEPPMGVELAHDTLFTHWPLLRELAEETREFRLWQEDLRRRAARWKAAGRPANRLLTGAELRDARRWENERGDELSAAERRFLAESRSRRRARWRRFGATAVVLLVVAGTLWFRQARSLSNTAADSLAATADAHTGDAYAQAQLALRAYRTRHTRASAVAVQSAYWGTGPVDRLLPDGRTRTLGRYAPGPTPTPSGASAGGSRGTTARFDRPASLSADGTELVTTTPGGEPAVWHLHGADVTRQPLASVDDGGAGALQGTIGAGGRYALFVRSVGNLMPGGHATSCSVRQLKEIADTTCLTVYDLHSGRPVAEIPVTAVGKSPQVVALSIDPGGHVAGAVVQDPSGGYLVRTWDLRTGRLRSRGRLPFDAAGVTGLWLAPGGRGAVVLTQQGGARILTRLVIGRDEVTAHRLADGMHDGGVAVSGDGLRVAAAVPAAAGDLPSTVRVWDLRTGKALARIGGLPTELASGHLVLDRTGGQVFFSWVSLNPVSLNPLPDEASDLTGTLRRNAHRLRDATTVRVARWRVGDDTVHDTGMRVTPGWTSVRPLGDGREDPVVLFTSGAVGLVLPRNGAPPPRERLHTLPPTTTGTAPKTAFRHLCDVLPGGELTALDRRALPDGAFTGDPCS